MNYRVMLNKQLAEEVREARSRGTVKQSVNDRSAALNSFLNDVKHGREPDVDEKIVIFGQKYSLTTG